MFRFEIHVYIHREDICWGKYIVWDPSAQETQGCCSSMSPGLSSSKAEYVFPTGACTQSTHIHHIYIHIYIYMYVHGWPHSPQRDTQISHTDTGSTNTLKPLFSLVEQDGDPLVAMQMPVYKEISSWTQTLSLPCGHPRPVADTSHVQLYRCTYTQSWSKLSWSPGECSQPQHYTGTLSPLPTHFTPLASKAT